MQVNGNFIVSGRIRLCVILAAFVSFYLVVDVFLQRLFHHHQPFPPSYSNTLSTQISFASQ